MGDRVVFNFKQEDGLYLCVYSHWGGTDRFFDLARALLKAQPRWNDMPYFLRIMVSELVGDQWSQETGFGIWASTEPNYDEASIDIDLVNKTVSDETGEHAWDSFIKYHLLDKKEDAVVQ